MRLRNMWKRATGEKSNFSCAFWLVYKAYLKETVSSLCWRCCSQELWICRLLLQKT